MDALQQNETIERVIRAAKREGSGMWFLGAVLLLIGAGAVVGALALSAEFGILRWVLGIGGGLIAAVGGLIFYVVATTQDFQSQFGDVLRKRPHTIEQVQRTAVRYTMEGVTVGHRVNVLLICSGAERFSVELLQEDAEAFVSVLRSIAPGAMFRE